MFGKCGLVVLVQDSHYLDGIPSHYITPKFEGKPPNLGTLIFAAHDESQLCNGFVSAQGRGGHSLSRRQLSTTFLLAALVASK